MRRTPKEQLHVDLERRVILEINEAWRLLNWIYFGEAMRPPAFELFDASNKLGQWTSRARTISISRKLVFEQPWEIVEAVIAHEMAHQFVDEVLDVRDESAHGPAFRATCERLGIDPAASGLPTSTSVEGSAKHVVQKIVRLLGLAESPNQHEAEAAAVAARKLMLKHNVDSASAPKRYGHRRLGAPTRRVDESARILAGILTGYFFVEGIWVGTYVVSKMERGRVFEIMGTPENLSIADYVHGFLEQSAERLWSAHRTKTGVRSNRDRRTFKAGVMAGFREKLELERRSERERALVWVRDADLERAFRQRHPYTRRRAHALRERNDSFHHGRDAGRRIVLSKAIADPSSSRGRLLGSGSG